MPEIQGAEGVGRLEVGVCRVEHLYCPLNHRFRLFHLGSSLSPFFLFFFSFFWYGGKFWREHQQPKKKAKKKGAAQ
jgi:hypothetical protein